MDRESVKKDIDYIISKVEGKNVLFVTTKNLNYIRNVQEIKLIKTYAADLNIIGLMSNNYIIRIIYIYLKLLLTRTKKYDVVFIGFAPQLVLPIWKRKIRNNMIIIDFFISMFDTFVNDRKKVKENTFFASVLKHIDQITLENADLVISDTKAHGKYFAELGARPELVKTLYLEADSQIYYPQIVAKDFELSNKYVVLYFGSVLPLQGVPIVLEAIKKCISYDDIRFIFIGPIDKISQLKKSDYPNTKFYKWLSQKDLARQIAMADLCLAGHFNGTIKKAQRTIAGKTYIYQAMDKKIILGEGEANRELFPMENNSIYYVPMGNSSALAEKIIELSRKAENE